MSGDGRWLFGIAGLACVACCIGPIVAVLGAIGIAGVAAVAVFGLAGVTVGLLAVPAMLARRRTRCLAEPTGTIPVAAPVVRRPGR